MQQRISQIMHNENCKSSMSALAVCTFHKLQQHASIWFLHLTLNESELQGKTTSILPLSRLIKNGYWDFMFIARVSCV